MISKQNQTASAAIYELDQAASVLNVTEFRLFELAYHEWFGSSAKEAVLEAAYIQYLAENEVPCWVRHYVRHTLQLCDEAGCYVTKMVSSELAVENPLMSTDLWILMTGAFLLSLLLV